MEANSKLFRPKLIVAGASAYPRHYDCPGPLGRLSALSVSHSKSVLYGVFVWARRTLNSENGSFRPLVPRPVWSTIHDCKLLLVPVEPY
jgi:hypothetical protein